jgi:hypothetical protein
MDRSDNLARDEMAAAFRFPTGQALENRSMPPSLATETAKPKMSALEKMKFFETLYDLQDQKKRGRITEFDARRLQKMEQRVIDEGLKDPNAIVEQIAQEQRRDTTGRAIGRANAIDAYNQAIKARGSSSERSGLTAGQKMDLERHGKLKLKAFELSGLGRPDFKMNEERKAERDRILADIKDLERSLSGQGVKFESFATMKPLL